MLNFAKVLCLLLAAKATSAQGPRSVDSAKKSFDKALKLSLIQMDKSYNETSDCVRAANLNLLMEIDNLEDGLNSRGPKSFRAAHAVMMTARDRRLSIDEISISLDKIFETERALLTNKQLLVNTCISSHPDNILGRMQAASCTNKVRKSLSEKVKNAKLYFSKKCEAAEGVAKTLLAYINDST